MSPPCLKLPHTLRSCTSKHHFMTAPLHHQQKPGFLLGATITTIPPGGMLGYFLDTPNQIPSPGITKLTTPELQSPVTARLKHFLYTFSAGLPLPPSAGLSQQVIPRERPEWAWAAQPSLQLQTDEEARPTRPNLFMSHPPKASCLKLMRMQERFRKTMFAFL